MKSLSPSCQREWPESCSQNIPATPKFSTFLTPQFYSLLEHKNHFSQRHHALTNLILDCFFNLCALSLNSRTLNYSIFWSWTFYWKNEKLKNLKISSLIFLTIWLEWLVISNCASIKSGTSNLYSSFTIECVHVLCIILKIQRTSAKYSIQLRTRLF